MLETRLIEVAADIEDKTGLDWSKISSYTTILAENGVPLTTEGGSIIPDDQTIGSLPATMPFNRLSGLLEKDKTGIVPKYFSRQLTAFDLTLDMLLRNNKAEVLADSRLTTINGREASIKLVDIVPYILSSGGVGGQVQVQKEEVGIKLNIAPTVNTDGYITVKVEPEVSTIFEFIGPDANIPRVKSRTSSTTIRVKDGESIVIGGLLSNDKKQTTYKLPFFHRLPFLGEKLFTSRSVIERKTDLIIQITPKIVVDEYSGIVKSDEMIKYEKYVTKNSSIKDYNETQDLNSEQSEVE
jgi:type II secretory pathway component GspD/PulD (secretin)